MVLALRIVASKDGSGVSLNQIVGNLVLEHLGTVHAIRISDTVNTDLRRTNRIFGELNRSVQSRAVKRQIYITVGVQLTSFGIVLFQLNRKGDRLGILCDITDRPGQSAIFANLKSFIRCLRDKLKGVGIDDIRHHRILPRMDLADDFLSNFLQDTGQCRAGGAIVIWRIRIARGNFF